LSVVILPKVFRRFTGISDGPGKVLLVDAEQSTDFDSRAREDNKKTAKQPQATSEGQSLLPTTSLIRETRNIGFQDLIYLFF